MSPRRSNPSTRFYQTCLREAEQQTLVAAPAGAAAEIALLRALIRRLGETLLQSTASDEQVKITALLLRALTCLAVLLRLEAAQAQTADDELARALQEAVQAEDALRPA